MGSYWFNHYMDELVNVCSENGITLTVGLLQLFDHLSTSASVENSGSESSQSLVAVDEWESAPEDIVYLRDVLCCQGFNFQLSPEKLEKLCYNAVPFTPHMVLLRSLFRKCHPDKEFWVVSTEEEYKEKYNQVSAWFGFTPDNKVIYGAGDRDTQKYFWKNVLKSVTLFQKPQNYSFNLELIKGITELVLSNTILEDLIRKNTNGEIYGQKSATTVLSNILSASKSRIEKFQVMLENIKTESKLFELLREWSETSVRFNRLISDSSSKINSFLIHYGPFINHLDAIACPASYEESTYVHNALIQLKGINNDLEGVSKFLRLLGTDA